MFEMDASCSEGGLNGTSVVMPKIGQTVEEASIVKWHKKEGDVVKKGDVLFEIETDKAVLEAESFFDGTLLKSLIPGKGKRCPCRPVAYIGEQGETVPDAARPASAAKQEAAKPAQPVRKEAEPNPGRLQLRARAGAEVVLL